MAPYKRKNKTDVGTIMKQIVKNSEKGSKTYRFNDGYDSSKPAQMWFQESDEGKILFIVFYSQACRWSRCLGCNLPSKMSKNHVPFNALMKQIDFIFNDPDVIKQKENIRKVIVSNNGSVLDQDTFSSTALMYMIAQFNLNLPNMKVLSLETRPEYVEIEELEFMARALSEGNTPTQLEIAVGFEAFDSYVRNTIFDKGLDLQAFEKLVEIIAPYGFRLKCYFMQKPIPKMTDQEAITDIQNGIDYLNKISAVYGVDINMHLNPTYAATGTRLEDAFLKGDFIPPALLDVARAAYHAHDKSLSIFIGLSDEGLAHEGGSFIRKGDEKLVKTLETFNMTQNFEILAGIVDPENSVLTWRGKTS